MVWGVQCAAIREQYAVCTVKRVVSSVEYSTKLDGVGLQRAEYIVQRSLYSEQQAVCSVQCTVCNTVQSWMVWACSVQRAASSVQCSVHNAVQS